MLTWPTASLAQGKVLLGSDSLNSPARQRGWVRADQIQTRSNNNKTSEAEEGWEGIERLLQPTFSKL